VELELVFEPELPERSGELAAEDAIENADGEEELPRGSDPTGAIDGEATAGRDDAVDVRMVWLSVDQPLSGSRA
jgi:hypothetical protein